MNAPATLPPPLDDIPLPQGARFAIGQLGQSLDGRIATRTGHSHYINGPLALAHLHRLRAHADAVLVGIGTVAADDPRLTVRHAPGRSPARVILDPRACLADLCAAQPMGALRCLAADGVSVLHVVATGAGPSPPRVERLELAREGAAPLAPAAVLAALARHGLNRILVEGGAVTLSHFLAAGALERLHLMVGAVLIGSGRIGIELPAIDHLDQAPRPAMRVYPLGPSDVLLDLDLTQTSGPGPDLSQTSGPGPDLSQTPGP